MLISDYQNAMLSHRGPLLLRPNHNYSFWELDTELFMQVLHELEVKAVVYASGIDELTPCERLVLSILRDSYIR